MYVYHGEENINYYLGTPHLTITPKIKKSDHTITITATSRSFDNETSCKISLVSSIIESTSN